MLNRNTDSGVSSNDCVKRADITVARNTRRPSQLYTSRTSREGVRFSVMRALSPVHSLWSTFISDSQTTWKEIHVKSRPRETNGTRKWGPHSNCAWGWKEKKNKTLRGRKHHPGTNFQPPTLLSPNTHSFSLWPRRSLVSTRSDDERWLLRFQKQEEDISGGEQWKKHVDAGARTAETPEFSVQCNPKPVWQEEDLSPHSLNSKTDEHMFSVSSLQTQVVCTGTNGLKTNGADSF